MDLDKIYSLFDDAVKNNNDKIVLSIPLAVEFRDVLRNALVERNTTNSTKHHLLDEAISRITELERERDEAVKQANENYHAYEIMRDGCKMHEELADSWKEKAEKAEGALVESFRDGYDAGYKYAKSAAGSRGGPYVER